MNRLRIVTAIAAMSIATVVSAHPHVKSAGPAPGSVVKSSPAALQIRFNEPVELAFSGVYVTNATGRKQPVGEVKTAANDKTQLIVPLKGRLAPGKYTVVWHAIGDDTHHVQGSYTFTVAK
jgi:methionine-rich copper-binding protein CopC